MYSYPITRNKAKVDRENAMRTFESMVPWLRHSERGQFRNIQYTPTLYADLTLSTVLFLQQTPRPNGK
jgi:hypothetical protein